MRLGDYITVKTGKLDSNAATENGCYPFFTCSRETLRINNYAFDCECVLLAGNGELNAKYYKGKFNAYQRTYVIESNDNNKLNTKYLYHYFDWYLEKLRYQAIGGVIKYIKLGNITEANIPLPCVAVQNNCVSILERIHDLIQSEEKQLKLYDELIKSRFIGQEDLLYAI